MSIAGLSQSQVHRFLVGLEFPAEQSELLRQAKENGADQGTLEAIGRVPRRTYTSIAEVQKSIGELI